MIRALLVDDDPAILELFSTVLEMNGFSVVSADCAREALCLIGKSSFEMIITDLRMESPTAGFDVVRAAAQLAPRPVIVIVTAHPVPAAEWRAAGADALYVKGSNTLTLPDHLKSLFAEKRHSGREVAVPTGDRRARMR